MPPRLPAFSLIEVVIAAALVTTALGAIFALTAMTIRLTVVSQERIMASQLAREGLEVVRQIRDTNFARDGCLLADQPEKSCAAWWRGLTDRSPSQSLPSVLGKIELDREEGFKLKPLLHEIRPFAAQSATVCGQENITRDLGRGRKQVFCRRLFLEAIREDDPATVLDESTQALRVRSQVAWLGYGRNSFRPFASATALSGANSCLDRSSSTEWCTEVVTLVTAWRLPP